MCHCSSAGNQTVSETRGMPAECAEKTEWIGNDHLKFVQEINFE